MLSATPTTVAVVAAGITLHEALKAADTLIAEGIDARVIDLYSVKPIDADDAARGGRGDRRPDRHRRGPLARGRHGRRGARGLVGDGELPPRVVHLAVREMPGSGKPAELLAAAGIDAEHIADAARALVGDAVAG